MGKIFFPSSRPRFVDGQLVIDEFQKIASALASKNKNIEAVYLFGSYANGSAGVHSDADILVVLKQDTRGKIDRLDEFILEFSDGPVPADVLVYTKAEAEEALNEGSHFLARATAGIRLVG